MDIFSYILGRNSGGGKGALVPQVVTELPITGESGVLYLVARQVTETNNVFDEYIWVNNDYELIGTAEIDISGKNDLFQYSTMPTASASNVGKIYQYVGTTNANYTKGYFYICVSDGEVTPTYSYVALDVQNLSSKQDTLVSGTNIKTINGNSILGSGDVTVSGGQTIQYDTMPTASADNLGDIIQYIGTTDSTYTNGYFYKCVENSGTYSWENIGVQDVSIGDSRLLTAKIEYNINLIFYSGTTFSYSSYPALKTLYDKIIEYNTDGTSFDAVIRLGGNNNFRNIYFNYIMFGNSLHFLGYNSSYAEYLEISMSSTSAVARRASNAYVNDNSNPGNWNSYLAINNTASYTPTSNYHPATKKYVDDSISSAVGNISTALANLVTVEESE